MVNRRPPFIELIKLQEDISQTLRDLASRTSGGVQSVTDWTPVLDLSENSRQFVVKTELPGVKQENIQVVFHEGSLHISGEKAQPTLKQPVRYLCLERGFGTFLRTVVLNTSVDVDHATASLESGVLTIRLPKLVNRRRVEKVIPVFGTNTDGK